jgi:tellurite resistance protein
MTAKRFYDLAADLPDKIEKITQRAVRRVLTHPSLTDERRIEMLRNVHKLTGAYLKVAEMLPYSGEFNDEEWKQFVLLCQALGFDPAGLKNRS